MKRTIFEYKSYKNYLNDLIKDHPKRGRGLKTAFAQAASCPMSSISRVLSGEAHFTFEQAKKISQHLGHSEDDARFFLLLLSHERSGTKDLREWYRKEMDREIQRHLTLKDRFKAKEVLSKEVQATFYSSWHYAAIHIALTIPALRTKEALANAFGLNGATISSILEFLTSVGMAEQRGNEYFTGINSTYLGNDSPLIMQHHTHWRMRAIHSLDISNRRDLHYSAVVTIPNEEFDELKALFARAIEEARKRWNGSSNETEVCAVTLDWFRVADGGRPVQY